MYRGKRIDWARTFARTRVSAQVRREWMIHYICVERSTIIGGQVDLFVIDMLPYLWMMHYRIHRKSFHIGAYLSIACESSGDMYLDPGVHIAYWSPGTTKMLQESNDKIERSINIHGRRHNIQPVLQVQCSQLLQLLVSTLSTQNNGIMIERLIIFFLIEGLPETPSDASHLLPCPYIQYFLHQIIYYSIYYKSLFLHSLSCLNLLLTPRRPNHPPALLPLQSTTQTNLFIPNKLPNHTYPALMSRQLCIELLRNIM